MKRTRIFLIAIFAVLLLYTGVVFAQMPCWMKKMANSNGIDKVHTEIGDKSLDGVMSLEQQKGVSETGGAMSWVLEKVATDSSAGAFFRKIAGIPDPFTYTQPKTAQFFSGLDSVATGNEMQKIKGIYNAVGKAIPRGGAPGSDTKDLSKLSTFEETLSGGAGWCRDQSMLLNTALQKYGIDSEVVNGTISSENMGHMWVRVTINDKSSPDYGKQFDLDPTWYKDFVPLPLRDGSAGNGEENEDCGDGSYYCGCNGQSYDDLGKCILDCHANMSCFEEVCIER